MINRRIIMALEEAEIMKNHSIIFEIGGEEFKVKWVAQGAFLYIEGRDGFYIHISLKEDDDDVLPKEAILKKFLKKYQKYCDKYCW